MSFMSTSFEIVRFRKFGALVCWAGFPQLFGLKKASAIIKQVKRQRFHSGFLAIVESDIMMT